MGTCIFSLGEGGRQRVKGAESPLDDGYAWPEDGPRQRQALSQAKVMFPAAGPAKPQLEAVPAWPPLELGALRRAPPKHPPQMRGLGCWIGRHGSGRGGRAGGRLGMSDRLGAGRASLPALLASLRSLGRTLAGQRPPCRRGRRMSCWPVYRRLRSSPPGGGAQGGAHEAVGPLPAHCTVARAGRGRSPTSAAARPAWGHSLRRARLLPRMFLHIVRFRAPCCGSAAACTHLLRPLAPPPRRPLVWADRHVPSFARRLAARSPMILSIARSPITFA